MAVDEVCVDRLVREEGLALSQIELLLNFVPLHRFPARRALPARPVRALVFSNGATADGYARVIGAACEEVGITVDIAGESAQAVATPENLLPRYDLVFAKGRSALEAQAVGCATVVADVAGAGPLVTPDNYEILRRRNFGIRELTRPHEVGWYRAQIARYCPQQAAQVSDRVRTEAAMEPAIDRLLAIYAAAMAAPAGPGDASLAAAVHCYRIAAPLKRACYLGQRVEAAERELTLARGAIAAQSRPEVEAERKTFEARVEALSAESSSLEKALGDRERELASAQEDIRVLRQQLAAFQSLPTVRLRDAVLKAPVLGPAVQAGARRLARLLPH